MGKRTSVESPKICRILYACPRPAISVEETCEEIKTVCVQYGFADARVKPKERNNAFFSEVPRGLTWFARIKTENWTAKFPRECHGATFSRVLGQDSSIAERAILKFGLRGPGWLRLDTCERVKDERLTRPELVTLAVHRGTYAILPSGEEGTYVGSPEDVVKRCDPDVLMGHKLDYLPRGRILCDVFAAAKEHLQHQVSYEMDALAQPGLGGATAVLEIADRINLVPLAFELAKQSGYTVNGCLNRGRSKRVEYALLHEFNKRDIVLPEPKSGGKDDDETPKRKRPKYEGGLVLEPEVGLHYNVAYLDFKSLYPSLICKHNVCFTTVKPGEAALPRPDVPVGIIPRVVRKYVAERRKVKELMKGETDQKRRRRLDARQNALKLMANSTYGCLGSPHSRFSSRAMAALITGLGRDNLEDTVRYVRDDLKYRIAYGDTDSLMPITGSPSVDEAKAAGRDIAVKINARQASPDMEIELADVYACMLLVTKKKYAAISTMTTEALVIRGLEMRKRDCPEIAKDACGEIVRRILHDADKNAVIEAACETLRRIDFSKIDSAKLVITNELSQSLDSYGSNSRDQHVIAARTLLARTGRRVAEGETVAYVVCRGGTPVPVELYENGTVDVAYYKTKQILPAVLRLMNAAYADVTAKLADAMGVDASSLTAASSCRRNLPEFIRAQFMFLP